MTLGELFDGFTHTAFRYESLPVYDVGGEEAERFAAWRDGRPRPERSVRTSPWLSRIAVTTAAGKRWSRVTVLDDPITEYQRFSLLAYVEAQAAGDEMRVIDRAAVPSPAINCPDFWLFDRGLPTACAAVLRYDDHGRFLAADVVDHDPDLGRYETAAVELSARSTALNSFLAVREQAGA